MDNPPNKTIGIIGGAGPMAGLLLARTVFTICQNSYKCIRDKDFPRVIVLSEPFQEMLVSGKTASKDISSQLRQAMQQVQSQGASTFAIACNTLHCFLGDAYPEQLIHLVNETTSTISNTRYNNVLVLATSTSRQNGLYDFKGSYWPTKELQREVDRVIDTILTGDLSANLQNRLIGIVKAIQAKGKSIDAVLLGCTELSLLMAERHRNLMCVDVVDPITIAAKKLCSEAFWG